MQTKPVAYTVHNRIENPFQRGHRVLLPAGTKFTSTNPRHRRTVQETRRTQTVLLRIVSDGWVDLWDDARRGVGYIHLPQITWAGSGSYWHDAKVTPELCAALGVPLPTLPDVSADLTRLDVIPAYGVGYDDRLD